MTGTRLPLGNYALTEVHFEAFSSLFMKTKMLSTVVCCSWNSVRLTTACCLCCRCTWHLLVLLHGSRVFLREHSVVLVRFLFWKCLRSEVLMCESMPDLSRTPAAADSCLGNRLHSHASQQSVCMLRFNTNVYRVHKATATKSPAVQLLHPHCLTADHAEGNLWLAAGA